MNIHNKATAFNLGDRVKVVAEADDHTGKIGVVQSITMRKKPDRFAYEVDFSSDGEQVKRHETWYTEHELEVVRDPH